MSFIKDGTKDLQQGTYIQVLLLVSAHQCDLRYYLLYLTNLNINCTQFTVSFLTLNFIGLTLARVEKVVGDTLYLLGKVFHFFDYFFETFTCTLSSTNASGSGLFGSPGSGSFIHKKTLCYSNFLGIKLSKIQFRQNIFLSLIWRCLDLVSKCH